MSIVIIGAGLAGLYTALKLAPLPVTVLSPATLGEGASSSWAQGGIAAALSEDDTPQSHALDTIKAGGGIVDVDVARLIAEDAPERIRDLLAYGVPFDRDLEGKLVQSREAAHSAKRIVRVRGDRAGYAIMQALIAAVRTTPSIRVLEGVTATSFETAGGRIKAVVGRETTNGNTVVRAFSASAGAVLATGGVGGLYAVTTNPPAACGDGIAMAARVGAVIADAEFVQFHPTAIDIGIDPAPLATEALRGEGAHLVNASGERFMVAQHPDAELAPRDIVARAVFREIRAGRGAFLDCRAAIGARFAEAYPTVYASCKAAGIDPATAVIPIAPAEHYHMGGVKTDVNGRTNVEGLWAVGEAASTGLHGANRLASNSLLEAVVIGARVATDIKANLKPPGDIKPASVRKIATRRASEAHTENFAELRQTMATHLGVERDEDGMRQALAVVQKLRASAGEDPLLANAALAAHFITEAALRRKESRGGHYRTDFPEASDRLQRRSSMTLLSLGLRAPDAARGMLSNLIQSGRKPT